MKKKKVFIFNSNSRASVYGIGTYLAQLIKCLKTTSIPFEMIHIYSSGNEVTVTQETGYNKISIPVVTYNNSKGDKYYSRNIAYLLREFIPEDKNTEYIFHLNFMNDPQLVINLKKAFKCKIILVSHYTAWSFALLGDEQRMVEIMTTKKKRSNEDKLIYEGIKKDERMIKKCDKFICVARHTLLSYSKACNIDKEKCLIINNALADEFIPLSETDKQDLREKYFIEREKKIILFAGRLDEVKGIHFLIKSFKMVLEKNPNAYLFLAGDGDFSRWIKETNECCTKIFFTGRLNRQQLYEFYRIADMGIVSSLHEEFGLVAIEMMMHRLPLIVSDTGGLSEIIEDSISGIKIPVLTRDKKRVIDSDLLARKINLLLNDNLYARKLGDAARKRFLEKYEMEKFKCAMLDLYQNI